MALSKLGLRASTAPTIKAREVTPAAFNIGGMIGKNDRQFVDAKKFKKVDDAILFLGDRNESFYLHDSVEAFFANTEGVDAELYIKPHVGNDGTSIDAVVGTATLVDGSAASTLRIDAAYKNDLAYGVEGNKVGYQIVNGDRFTTAGAVANSATDVFVDLDSVVGIKVGDIIKIVSTGGGGATVYKKITVVDEGLKRVTFAGAFHATANMDVDDVATVIGFRLRTFKKDANGITNEVDTALGEIFVTMEPEVSEFYVENVFQESLYLKATDLASVSTLEATFPANVSTTTFLASGANGTAPTTSAHYQDSLDAFDNIDVRFLGNVETSDETIQKAGEAYTNAKELKPKWVTRFDENLTKAQLVTHGQNFQRTDEVSSVGVAQWLGVSDPFNLSPTAPHRFVPNVGFVMGAWIRSIAIQGIHFIPATAQITLKGVLSVRGDQILNDTDRTELAEAGVNVIHERPGIGFQIRNLFTPSTDSVFKFSNGITMKSFIQASVKDSLTLSENTPNVFDRIQADKRLIEGFLHRLYDRGTNNATPRGEFFGQFERTDGTPSVPEDHFYVRSDTTVNPQADVNNGIRKHVVYFTFPTPTGTIEISVGILV